MRSHVNGLLVLIIAILTLHASQVHGSLKEAARLAGQANTARSNDDYKQASAYLEQAVRLAPDQPILWFNYGSVLVEAGELQHAVQAFKSALALPSSDEGRRLTRYYLAVALHNLDRHGEAVIEFRAVQNKDGSFPSDEGHALYKKSLQSSNSDTPTASHDRVPHPSNRESIVTSVKSRHVAELRHACVELGMRGTIQVTQAFAKCKEWCEADPMNADAFLNFGIIAAARKGQAVNVAVQAYRKAIELDPENFKAHSNLAQIYLNARRFKDALHHMQAAHATAPTSAIVLQNLILAELQTCHWDEWDERIASMDRATKLALETPLSTNPTAGVDMPFNLRSIMTNPVDLRRLTERYSNHLTRLVEPGVYSPRGMLTEGDNKVLNIAYLSKESFTDSLTQEMMQSLYAFHNRTKVKVFCFGIGHVSKQTRLRSAIATACDEFHEIPLDTSPAKQILFIRQFRIHIAIELTGHGLPRGFEILKARVAPVQLHASVYPNTLGIEGVNTMLSDKILVPPEAASYYYTEKQLYLPHHYHTNHHRSLGVVWNVLERSSAHGPYLHSREDILGEGTASDRDDRVGDASRPPVTREDFGVSPDAFTYCAFNTLFKLEPHTYAVWMNILQRVPNAILLLPQITDLGAENLRRYAEDAGISPSRLQFMPRTKKKYHLGVKRLICDVYLDTPAFNGHCTAHDTVYAGIPFVARPLQHMAARVATSVLKVVNASHLSAQTPKEYEDIAVRLALDPLFYTATRRKLDRARDASPLFDNRKWTRDYELGLQLLWDLFELGREKMHVIVGEKESSRAYP